MEVPRLSCEQCRRRKTKCDKENPCSACAKAGIVCNAVARNRKSRGSTKRVQRQGSSLDARVAHLEDLVVQLKTHAKQNQRVENSEPLLENGESQKQPASNVIGNFVAPSFWEALSQEVTGIRDILEDGEEESEEASPDNHTGPEQNQNEVQSETTTRTLLFNHPSTVPEPDLSSDMTFMLLTIYQQRVDCVFKVLDWPAAAEMIRKNHIQDPTVIQNTPSEIALEHSIYFTALCTLSDEECENMLSCAKGPLLKKLRILAEISISKAGLLQHPDLTLLQAFVIYLAGLRPSSQCASSWSLLSIAVRIANSMRLGSGDKTNHSIYDIQIRRRLWFSIGMLDSQAALDRGSLPLLYLSDFANPPPLNINDCDLHAALVSSAGFTDMSFSSLTHQALLCQTKMYEKPIEGQAPWEYWNEKIKALNEFEESSKQKYAHINDQSSSLERYTKIVAAGSLANIKVMLRRPPYRIEVNSVPQWDEFNVMKATTEVLHVSLEKQDVDEFFPWKWYYWVKWYALAVLLAELCKPFQGADVEHSLEVAEMSFKKYSHLISDAESGMLWKPIAKLMHRVQKLRRSEGGPPTKPQSPYRADATSGDLGLGALQIPDRGFDFGTLDPGMFMPTSPPIGSWSSLNFPQTGSGRLDDILEGRSGSTVAFDDYMCWTQWDNFMRDMNGQLN